MANKYQQQSNDFSHWYQAYPGKMILSLELARLARVLPGLYGEYALQINGPNDALMLRDAHMKQKIQLFDCRNVSDASFSLQADLTELPLAPNSMDLVVLPHVLEFAQNPRQLLSQCYQMMAPHGHLVIFSFCPFSVWGVWRHCKGRQGQPWSGKFYRRARIDYWLDAIGFSVIKRHQLCFHWPTQSAFWAKYSFVFEITGQIAWPGLGSIYMVVAQKQIHHMTPIKASRWAKKRYEGVGCPTAY